MNLKIHLEYNQTQSFTITDITLQNNIIKSDTFHSLLQYIFPEFEYKILDHERIFIQTPEEIDLVLIENHDHPISGHQGFQRTYENIKDRYYWENMKETICDYIRKFVKNRKPILTPIRAQ